LLPASLARLLALACVTLLLVAWEVRPRFIASACLWEGGGRRAAAGPVVGWVQRSKAALLPAPSAHPPCTTPQQLTPGVTLLVQSRERRESRNSQFVFLSSSLRSLTNPKSPCYRRRQPRAAPAAPLPVRSRRPEAPPAQHSLASQRCRCRSSSAVGAPGPLARGAVGARAGGLRGPGWQCPTCPGSAAQARRWSRGPAQGRPLRPGARALRLTLGCWRSRRMARPRQPTCCAARGGAASWRGPAEHGWGQALTGRAGACPRRLLPGSAGVSAPVRYCSGRRRRHQARAPGADHPQWPGPPQPLGGAA
jgi:hypothetical protein